MNLQPIFIQDVLKPIVDKVSANLLPQLQQADEMITGVHYQYGHPLEIVNTLGQFTQGETSRYNKYPLIALFLDTTEDVGRDKGVYAEYNLHLAIIRACKSPNQVAKERDDFNFKPVLIPIYLELMKQMKYSGVFTGFTDKIPHRKTNRYYWGKEGLFGNEGNIFNDWVDCVEIENLKVKIVDNYCPPKAV